MSSSLNQRFAQSMTHLESTDPNTARTIKAKLESLKEEAATWRRKAQGATNHGETPKKAFDGEEVHQ